ncbi:MAG: NAD(+) diphosphatase [Kiritimatiellae bacterium]|nr:NAD(+) diphosphatase [Kiritimatiellia bacterium]
MSTLSAEEYRKIAAERMKAHHEATNRFCGKCGGAMRHHADPNENAYVCEKCGYLAYPKICPAIIVLVTKGDKILLQRNSHYGLKNWTLVAGFVDPGESFEDAVRREVAEEASIKVKNIRYFGSQSWPFPSTIMVGFTAEYESGELTPDGEEVIESGWFSKDNLPEIPLPGSIARALIDEFLNDHEKNRPE